MTTSVELTTINIQVKKAEYPKVEVDYLKVTLPERDFVYQSSFLPKNLNLTEREFLEGNCPGEIIELLYSEPDTILQAAYDELNRHDPESAHALRNIENEYGSEVAALTYSALPACKRVTEDSSKLGLELLEMGRDYGNEIEKRRNLVA